MRQREVSTIPDGDRTLPFSRIAVAALLILLAAYLACEALLFRMHTLPLVQNETDAVLFYLPWAHGPIFQIPRFHGPGYAAAIKLFAVFTRDFFLAAKLISIVSGGLFLFAAWAVFRSMSTLAQSVLAAALLTLNPVVLKSASLMLSDSLAAALFWGACALIIVPQGASRRRWLLAGALCGAAYLTRYQYLASSLLLPIAAGFFRPAKERLSRALPIAGMFYAGFAVVCLPWMLWLFQQKGSPIWSENHLNLAFKLYGLDGGFNDFPTMREFPNLTAVIARNPVWFVKSWVMTAVRDIPRELCYIVPGTGAGIVLSGIVVFLAKRDWRRCALAAVIAAYCAFSALIWVDPRYLLPVIPVICFAITDLLFSIPIHLPEVPWLPRKIAVGVIALVPLIAIEAQQCTPGRLAALFGDAAPEYGAAADWVSAHRGPNVTVFAAKPHIAYLSGTKWIDFRDYGVQRTPLASFGSILAAANPTYVVIDDRYAGVHFPQLRPLLDAATPIAGLRTVFRVTTPSSLTIYEYSGGGTSAANAQR